MELLLIFQELHDKYWIITIIIDGGGPVSWHPKSRDLTPLNFFFRRYIKSLVYDTPVESEENLTVRIAVPAAAGDISYNPRIVGRVHRSLENRCTYVTYRRKWPTF